MPGAWRTRGCWPRWCSERRKACSGVATSRSPTCSDPSAWCCSAPTFVPGMTIGPGFLMPHPNGVVIGQGLVIGENVSFGNGVTTGVGQAPTAQQDRSPDHRERRDRAGRCGDRGRGAHRRPRGGRAELRRAERRSGPHDRLWCPSQEDGHPRWRHPRVLVCGVAGPPVGRACCRRRAARDGLGDRRLHVQRWRRCRGPRPLAPPGP